MPVRSTRAEHGKRAVARASSEIAAAIAATSNEGRSDLEQKGSKRHSLNQVAQSERTNPFGRPMGSAATGARLSPRQLAIARALARGGSISATAREGGVGRVTVHRWMRLPAFQAELNRLHELLATQPVGERETKISASPSPRRREPRSTHAIDRQFDRMLDEFLGRGIPRVPPNTAS